GRVGERPGERSVRAGRPVAPDPCLDLRARAGVVRPAAPRLARRPGEEVLDADGGWAVPGLWDHHVHFTQAATTFDRLDLTTAGSAGEALRMVADHLAGPDAPPPGVPAARLRLLP